MTTLRSYLGDPALKAALLVEIEKHEVADQITKGTYGKMNGAWHGCAIGCSLRSLNILQGALDINDRTDVHDRYPEELGWPLWLAHLEDHIFEHLSDTLGHAWPRRLADAVPVGVDLTPALAKILRWTLVDDTWGVIKTTDNLHVQIMVRCMGDLFDHTIAGETVSGDEWNKAARAVRAARAGQDDRAVWAAWATWAAHVAWADRDAWAACATWADLAAWDAGGFYPALADYVLTALKESA